MMVVPVLITNCQVSLNPKIGPEAAQTTITETAPINVRGFPAAVEIDLENLVKRDDLFLLTF
jgi:hypothetical protein